MFCGSPFKNKNTSCQSCHILLLLFLETNMRQHSGTGTPRAPAQVIQPPTQRPFWPHRTGEVYPFLPPNASTARILGPRKMGSCSHPGRGRWYASRGFVLLTPCRVKPARRICFPCTPPWIADDPGRCCQSIISMRKMLITSASGQQKRTSPFLPLGRVPP